MMTSPYHPRGLLNGFRVPAVRHLREFWRDPAYRALHRFHSRLAGTPRFHADQVSFGSCPIRLCDGPSFLSAWDEIFVNRIYDLGPMEHVPCLVDAGANIGLAALFWKLRYRDFRYLGFEPDPTVAECCRRNLRTWGIEGELVEAALGRTDGMIEFMREGADAGRVVAAGGPGTIPVPMRRLSALMPPVVDLLKIDVEGAEGDVLADVAPVLDRVRALFVEWHGVAGRGGLGAITTILEAAGFDCFPQVAGGPARPFVEKSSPGVFCQHVNLFAVRP